MWCFWFGEDTLERQRKSRESLVGSHEPETVINVVNSEQYMNFGNDKFYFEFIFFAAYRYEWKQMWKWRKSQESLVGLALRSFLLR